MRDRLRKLHFEGREFTWKADIRAAPGTDGRRRRFIRVRVWGAGKTGCVLQADLMEAPAPGQHASTDQTQRHTDLAEPSDRGRPDGPATTDQTQRVADPAEQPPEQSQHDYPPATDKTQRVADPAEPPPEQNQHDYPAATDQARRAVSRAGPSHRGRHGDSPATDHPPPARAPAEETTRTGGGDHAHAPAEETTYAYPSAAIVLQLVAWGLTAGWTPDRVGGTFRVSSAAGPVLPGLAVVDGP
ncbi:hypothetical protein [Actinoplanes sp. NPDC049599]|uniref:hypothetical protein n=1 Tax=Actinoplanes sp. NPDC049599 TaxID=3363903 RepID=UPI0037AA4BB3